VRSGPDTFFLEHLYQMLRLPFHLVGQVPDAPGGFPITQGPGMDAIPVSFRQQLGGSLSMAHGKLHQTTMTERRKWLIFSRPSAAFRFRRCQITREAIDRGHSAQKYETASAEF
jgi:hypothetical protein